MPVIANNIGGDAYNKYSNFHHLGYNCLTYLLNNNEVIWKLLYYTDPDAWSKSNLTYDQKISLIYTGGENEMEYRIFQDVGQPDVATWEATILRISPHSMFPDNRTVGTVNMLFEVYSHYKINHLSNYTTRLDTITQQILETFNGAEIGGLGKLFFDRLGFPQDRGIVSGQLPFRGRWILMSTKSA